MSFVNARHLLGLAIFSCYIALLGAILAFFSMIAFPRFQHLADSIDSQQATLDRRPFVFGGVPTNYTSWRSRIFVPYATRGWSQLTGMKYTKSYVLFRWLSASFALAAFALLVARQAGGGWWYGALTAGLFALTLLPTFLHAFETPTDFTDAFFFSILTLMALEKRRLLFAFVLLIAITNRESAIFATAIWFALHSSGIRRSALVREITYCTALGASGTAIVFWLRVHFAVRLPTGSGLEVATSQPFTQTPDWPLGPFIDFFRQPYFGSPIFYLMGYLLLFSALFSSNWHRFTPPMRRLVMAAAAIFIISLPFANIPEIRVYIPSLVIVTFAAAVLLRQNIFAVANVAPNS